MITVSQTPPVAFSQPVDPAAQRSRPAPTAQDSPKSRYGMYYSPVVRIDPQTQQAVWEVRDPQSGRIVQQFPSEAQLRAYREAAAPHRATPSMP
jgi:hypothetical protein